MDNNTKFTKVVCPECMNEIDLDADRDYVVGDLIECPYCGSELEVASVQDELKVIVVEKDK